MPQRKFVKVYSLW